VWFGTSLHPARKVRRTAQCLEYTSYDYQRIAFVYSSFFEAKAGARALPAMRDAGGRERVDP
jgi:hypothetical protein